MTLGGRSITGRMSAFGAVALVCGTLSAWAPSHSTGVPHTPKVLLVGSYNGKAGQFKTIQAAVDAASPGDWILVGPGDYHEIADETGHGGNPADGQMGGVYIAKSGITLRGMDRNSVVVDGTNPGATACSSKPGAQNYGRLGPDGIPVGRNGILVWKASDVSVENMTVCNFLAGTGASGNQVWWNGGAGSGKIGLTGYWGSYLTATSTFLKDETTAAEYGIFASNSAGPASFNQLYGSNMNDSGTYVGACLQRCDVVLNHLWMENNALGYSGTNSGGTIVIENSVRQQPGRPGHQHRRRRRPARPAGRPVPERRAEPDHPHPLLLGAHPQLPAQQQQRQGPGGGQCGGGTDRHRNDHLGRPLRHGDGQHHLPQRRLGHPVHPLRPVRQAQPAPDLRRCRRS